jgi:hypothetical protein
VVVAQVDTDDARLMRSSLWASGYPY